MFLAILLSAAAYAGEVANTFDVNSLYPSAQPPETYRSPAPTASFAVMDGGKDLQLCERYIRSDGTYGEMGMRLRFELLGREGSKVYRDKSGSDRRLTEYFTTRNIPKIRTLCKRYYDLTVEERLNFWIWYMMAVSWDESKCFHKDHRVNLEATNGIAAGEFQINEEWSHRKWRGRACDVTGPKLEVDGISYRMANPVNNVPCAVQILGHALCGFYNTNSGKCTEPRAPFGPHLYWHKLKTEDSNVIRMIKEFPLCGN